MFVIRRKENLLIKRLSYRRRRHHHHHHRHLHLYVSFAYLQNSFKKKIIYNFFKFVIRKEENLLIKRLSYLRRRRRHRHHHRHYHHLHLDVSCVCLQTK